TATDGRGAGGRQDRSPGHALHRAGQGRCDATGLACHDDQRHPRGNVKSTTEDTRTLPSGVTTKTTTTTLTGTVAAYEAGKTLTVTRPDGSKVTNLINEKSTVPTDLVIGKPVTILPMPSSGTGDPVAQTITYVTTIKK